MSEPIDLERRRLERNAIIWRERARAHRRRILAALEPYIALAGICVAIWAVLASLLVIGP